MDFVRLSALHLRNFARPVFRRRTHFSLHGPFARRVLFRRLGGLRVPEAAIVHYAGDGYDPSKGLRMKIP